MFYSKKILCVAIILSGNILKLCFFCFISHHLSYDLFHCQIFYFFCNYLFPISNNCYSVTYFKYFVHSVRNINHGYAFFFQLTDHLK